ncbi:MAG: FAD-dependent oxidoreductase [Oscillospiraceae bacterium]|jgi:2,4-dienoyl-CoA reductase-like NADH-dependent reductase (Old Yellow Enzyme family)/thioredoxin reductase|nr:FAD-dependent oxidoreductase [Oscillospiraceae bacterium]
MYEQKYPRLFTPLRIRGTLLKNRVMSAPNMLFRTFGGRPDDYYVRYLEHKARGGAAIVTLGEASVGDGGNHTPAMEMTLENAAVFSEMAQAIHEHGAAASVELTHGGLNARPRFNRDPSRLVSPSGGTNEYGGAARAMTEEDMERVAGEFADAAEYYARAGFDAVLLHCGHGWLISQFLSPITNTRTDEYGGSPRNRMRFPLRVIKAVRERLGGDKAVLLRVSGSERRDGGYAPPDIAEFLSRADEYADMAEVSSDDFEHIFATPYLPRGQNVELAEAIKRSGKVKMPIFTVGSILGPAQAEEIIASGRADGVSMSRALIADPFLPKKAAEGREEDIRPCLRCLNCTDSDNATRHFVCSVNPLVSREARLGFGDEPPPAARKKRVLIVGGGPAGLQAAITSAGRGHETTLIEKTASLGGLLRFSDSDERKAELRAFKDYLIRRAGKMNIRTLLNTVPTDGLLGRLRPDAIIVATGSVPVVPAFIKGYERARHATEAYSGAGARGSAVIIGGGLVGVEAGLHLAGLGRRVAVLELAEDYGGEASGVYRLGIARAIARLGLSIITGARAMEITPSGVVYERAGETKTLEADDVFYAVGMRPYDAPYFELCGKAPSAALAGDAKKVGKTDGAVHGGFFAAMDI